MKILLIGGTGTISTHTLHALVADGHAVTSFNRSGQGDSVIAGDRKDRTALAAAIDAVRPDVLIDFVCFTPEDTAALIAASAGQVGHLIFVSTVDAFGFPQKVPILEDAPRRPGIAAYAQAKQVCEDLVLGASGLEVTIARPTYSMSEKFVISLFNHQSVGLMQRLRRGLPVALTDGGRISIHPSDARDTGRMIAAMAGARIAFGKTYTAGSRGVAMKQRDYVGLIAEVVGASPIFVDVPLTEIDAMALREAENTVFSNVTRFDLDFAFNRFEVDFPTFHWSPNLKEPIAAYLSRIEREGRMDGPLVEDLETAILDRLGRRGG